MVIFLFIMVRAMGMVVVVLRRKDRANIIIVIVGCDANSVDARCSRLSEICGRYWLL